MSIDCARDSEAVKLGLDCQPGCLTGGCQAGIGLTTRVSGRRLAACGLTCLLKVHAGPPLQIVIRRITSEICFISNCCASAREEDDDPAQPSIHIYIPDSSSHFLRSLQPAEKATKKPAKGGALS